jgi:hypothetical protein
MSHDQPQPQPQDFLLARASEMSLSSLLEAKSPSISGMFLKSVSGMIVAILAIILKGEFEFFFIHRQLLQDHERSSEAFACVTSFLSMETFSGI